MALYKNGNLLTLSQDAAFDALHSPGTAAPHPGIYRCTACGDEIAIAGGHTLPPQNHNSTLPPAGKSSGNFWFIRFSNNKGPSNPAVKRTGPRPAAYLSR